jgi:cell division protein FtsI/penicillin-binding protein 2
MWLAPWDNNVRGGDQLAHALWAFSTGGPLGSGPGLGDPSMIPAGHTDLVLPAIAEEWGFAGVAAIGLLFLVLAHRAFRAAMRAVDETTMFLAFGLGVLFIVEMLLISAGVLGAMPLSGVVSPFLSAGNSAMLANFLIFAIILGISATGRETDEVFRPLFGRPVTAIAIISFCLLGVLEGKAAYYQVFHRDDFVARDSYVIEEDGVRRAQVNPRLTSLARAIPRGLILDRNGIPLAANDCQSLTLHKTEYTAMGVALDPGCNRPQRYYPLGAATVHLVGDLRTGRNFHATNASLIEHDSNTTLQGFGDVHELARVVPYRHQPMNPAMREILARGRNVHTTIDARLQMRLTDLLRTRLGATGTHGAAVVLDTRSGDLLALADFPIPDGVREPTPDEMLDRGRYGEYPPGSTFKLVTAMAALRVNPDLRNRSYQCIRLKDGRAGNMVKGFNRPIRDDVKDHPHGRINMEEALAESCNAYFAQLGTYDVGATALRDTAALLDIQVGDLRELTHLMPMASYGQGPVVVSPFKMARVAAAIAAGGEMSQGRWVLGAANNRTTPPRRVIRAEDAVWLQHAMRLVVIQGTARAAMQGLKVDTAGKTGTAQVEVGAPHSWFAGYAPYTDGPVEKQIAYAVVVEHGGYGAEAAGPIARGIVEAAHELGIIQ